MPCHCSPVSGTHPAPVPLAGHLAICYALARAPKLPALPWLCTVLLTQAGGTAESPGSAQGRGKAGFAAGVGDVIRGAEEGHRSVWNRAGEEHPNPLELLRSQPQLTQHCQEQAQSPPALDTKAPAQDDTWIFLSGFIYLDFYAITADRILAGQAAAKLPRNITK